MKAFKIDRETGIYLDDITFDDFVASHKKYYDEHRTRSVYEWNLKLYYDLYTTCTHTDNIIFLNEVGGTMNERKYPRQVIFDIISYTMRGYYKDKLCVNQNITYLPNTAYDSIVLFKRIQTHGVDYYKVPLGTLDSFHRGQKIKSFLLNE